MIAEAPREARKRFSKGTPDDFILLDLLAQQSFDSPNPFGLLFFDCGVGELHRLHAGNPDLEVEAGVGRGAEVLAREGIDLLGVRKNHYSLVSFRLQEMQGDLGQAKEILGGKGYGATFGRIFTVTSAI